MANLPESSQVYMVIVLTRTQVDVPFGAITPTVALGDGLVFSYCPMQAPATLLELMAAKSRQMTRVEMYCGAAQIPSSMEPHPALADGALNHSRRAALRRFLHTPVGFILLIEFGFR